MSKRITVDGVEYVPASEGDLTPSDAQIVIAQRGWVFVGDVREAGEDLVITGAKNIRRWGTTRGLGELRSGPTPDTEADEYGTVRIHRLAVVARIDVEEGSWS